MDGDVGWTLVVAVVMLVGLCGVVVPILPGLLLMWAAALAYGFAVGWSALGIGVMVLATVLVATGLVAGVLLPQRTAAAGGASRQAQLGGLAGAVVGFFVIPFVGLIVGGLVGVYGVEYARLNDHQAAWTATLATAKGFGISILLDLALGSVLLAAWAVWALTVVF